METPSIYGVLGVQKVINIHKKNVKEKNYESENDIGKSQKRGGTAAKPLESE